MSNKYKIDFIESENGCFICTSHKPKTRGYFRVMHNWKSILLHRLVYEECFGEIPEGLIVRHKCDNRKCINPEHLEIGTHKDNSSDMVRRGRSAKGEKVGNSKYSEEIIRYIRESPKSNAELSRELSITDGYISAIRSRKTWKYI